MEVFALIYLFLLFVFSCLIARLTYVKFSKHPVRLTITYSVLLFLGLSFIGFKYWQFATLNHMTVPFTQATENILHFTFLPQKNGTYSVDLTFLNSDINKKYEHCVFTWEKSISNEEECKNALVFRTLTGEINNKYFSGKAHYKHWNEGDLAYGYKNHRINGPSLNIIKFKGKRNTPIPIRIKIDAKVSEIERTQPAIIIGSDEKSFYSFNLIIPSFKIFAIPFVFSIFTLTFH